MAADNRGDLDAIMRCYSENVELIPPQGEPVSGAAAVRAHYAGLLARERLEVRIELVETQLTGSTATVRGHTTGRRVALSDEAVVAIDDEFEAALRRGTDGGWRIQRLRWWREGPG